MEGYITIIASILGTVDRICIENITNQSIVIKDFLVIQLSLRCSIMATFGIIYYIEQKMVFIEFYL